MPRRPPQPCLRCPQLAVARGLCKRCYRHLDSRIRQGDYPGWDQAAAEGLCLPLGVQGRDGERGDRYWDWKTDQMSEEELDALVESRRATMPEWRPDEE